MTERLTAFTAADADRVAGWVRSPDEAEHWCGRRVHPFPAELVREWQADPDATAYLFEVDGEPAGYGEIWLDADEDEAELARIVLAPAHRGRGLGRELVSRLRERARETDPGEIVRRVNPANENALRCYQSVGFIRINSTEETDWNRGQPVNYVWLRA